MDTNMISLQEKLMTSDKNFRQLATEHKKYEVRLEQLSALHYPNEDEQREEALLKKKKLAVKDQMYAMLTKQDNGQKVKH